MDDLLKSKQSSNNKSIETPSFVRKYPIIKVIALAILTFASFSMIFWILKLPFGQNQVWHFIEMKFNTSLCLFLLSELLLLHRNPKSAYNKVLSIILPVLVTLLAALTLSEYIFHIDIEIDQFFVAEKITYNNPFPGRPSLIAALNLFLLGIGFVALTNSKRSAILFAEYCFHTVTTISIIGLLGYICGVPFYHSIWHITAMDIHTSIIFCSISIAASMLNPFMGIMRIFTSSRIGDKVAKRVFLIVVILAILCRMARLQIERARIWPLEVGVNALLVCFCLSILFVLWLIAKWVNKLDDRRYIAEQKAKALNLDLERRVEERSAEIRKSEARYRSLIEQASDAIYVTDSNSNFTDVNESACQMLGYSREELLTMNAAEVIDPENLEQDPLADGRRYTQARIKERRLKRKNGGIFYAEINVKKFDENSVVVIARDITERRKMMNSLQEAELKFRSLAEKSLAGIYIYQEPQFQYINPKFAEIFGFEPEELMDVDAAKRIVHPDYSAVVEENTRKRLEGEITSADYEVMGLKKDGSTNWVRFLGSVTQMDERPALIGTVLDITQSKVAEQKLHESEERYRLLFYGTPLPIFIYEFETLRVLDVNDVALRTYGYTREEALSMTIDVLRPSSTRTQLRHMLDQIDTYKDVTHFGVFDHVKKNGTRIKMDISGYKLHFNGKDCMLCLYNDVTEKEKAIEQLQELNENLQKQARELATSNADLEQFAYAASHDLQEPLRMITSFLTRLELKYSDIIDDRGKQYIHFATDGAKRMRELILDLLAFSRAGRMDPHMETVDVTKLLDEGFALYKDRIAELKATISYNDMPVVSAYRTPLMQVFQNLVSNGIKYRKEGVLPVIEIKCRETEFEFEFSVRDNGIGIDSQYFEKIFIVFQRLHSKNEYSGTGMGLAITKKIVENMSGSIWVESEEGKGSIFYFTIPKNSCLNDTKYA